VVEVAAAVAAKEFRSARGARGGAFPDIANDALDEQD